ncbi:uncharacterized protein CCOS01_16222 [Colletotrichum costaricense]|uniref:Uncharacterized protein n=1 Tax=Colletotrichum costaricense TaxID=1209916 RepID=A0AAJ0DSV1_9PEZI|nr:uncharacterized protein CCOS01_16222 [Colletotrichum costaricense]KAK1507916.1 hypothetical protein CCOS01_16222 [Colletotrichum costaricense]
MLYYPTPVGLLWNSLYLTDITMSVFARSDLFATKGESLCSRHPRLDSASGGAALVFHAGLFPVLPVWLATGQWYLDGKTAKLCAGSTGLYPPPCRGSIGN